MRASQEEDVPDVKLDLANLRPVEQHWVVKVPEVDVRNDQKSVMVN